MRLNSLMPAKHSEIFGLKALQQCKVLLVAGKSSQASMVLNVCGLEKQKEKTKDGQTVGELVFWRVFSLRASFH